MRSDEVSGPGKASSSSREEMKEDDELAGLEDLEVEDFLFSHPETAGDAKAAPRTRDERPSSSEMAEVVCTPYHLFSALLSRDRRFASALRTPPRRVASVLDIVDDEIAAVLDSWYGTMVRRNCIYADQRLVAWCGIDALTQPSHA